MKEKEFRARRFKKIDEEARILEGQKTVLKELETTNEKERKSRSKRKKEGQSKILKRQRLSLEDQREDQEQLHQKEKEKQNKLPEKFELQGNV